MFTREPAAHPPTFGHLNAAHPDLGSWCRASARTATAIVAARAVMCRDTNTRRDGDRARATLDSHCAACWQTLARSAGRDPRRIGSGSRRRRAPPRRPDDHMVARLLVRQRRRGRRRPRPGPRSVPARAAAVLRTPSPPSEGSQSGALLPRAVGAVRGGAGNGCGLGTMRGCGRIMAGRPAISAGRH